MESPMDKVLVQIESKYQEKVGSFILDPSYRPEWNATIRGKVIGLPRRISKDPFKTNIIPEIKVGDEILFSYLVVFDRDFITDPDYFTDQSDGNPFVHEYTDGHKRTLRVVRMPDKTMAAILLDPRGELLDGCQGDYRTVEKYLTGFKFNGESTIHYCNMFLAEEEYWMVDWAWVFGRKVEDGYQMVGGYVLMEPLFEQAPQRESGLIVPDYLKVKVSQHKARIVSIGTPQKGQPELGLKPGDEVYIDYARCEKYEIDGKQYLITQQKKLLGK